MKLNEIAPHARLNGFKGRIGKVPGFMQIPRRVRFGHPFKCIEQPDPNPSCEEPLGQQTCSTAAIDAAFPSLKPESPPAAQFARDVHHVVQLRGRQHASRHQQRLIGHQQPLRTANRRGDRRRQMRVDPLPVAGQRREFFLYRLLMIQTGLPRVEQRRADHHVGQPDIALNESERSLEMELQRGGAEN